MNYHRFFAALFAVFAIASQGGAQTSVSVAQRSSQLNKLLDQEWQWQMRDHPAGATRYGDYRYNNRWGDFSVAHEAKSTEIEKRFLARFEAIDTTGFSEQDRLDRELMVRWLKNQIEGYRLKAWEMPVNQFMGLQMELANFATQVPADSVQHYEDWITRLNSLPTVIDQLIGVLRQGEKDKLMPPKFLLEQVAAQCRSLAKIPGMQNPFAKPLAKFPKTIAPADQQRLRAAMVAAVDTNVRPAYRKLADFIATDYAPAGRTEAGIWALPNGRALYRYSVRTRASTNMSPDQIYNLGIAQVAKVEKEQTAIVRKLGFQNLKAFRESLKTNPKLYATSREEILDLFRKYVAQMRPDLPELFGTLLPKAASRCFQYRDSRKREPTLPNTIRALPTGRGPELST